MPLVLAGDLNSLPDSAVYEFLEQNTVRPDHPDLAGDDVGILESLEMRHALRLRDSYSSALGRRYCTNFTQTFVGIIDYIRTFTWDKKLET